MKSDLLLWIPLLPLAGAVINLVLGRWLPRGLVHFVAVAAVASAFGVVLWAVFGDLWPLFEPRAENQAGELPPVELVQTVYTWIEVADFRTDLAFRLDTLSAVMCLVVTGVGSLIHLYSAGYMAEEPRYAAYFGYLNLFTSAMLILVLGANMPVMFVGWEGVGVCSYLLIGFWFTNDAYASAGRKAFVVNRIGDFAFLLGMFLLFWATKDLAAANASDLDFGLFRSDAAVAAVKQEFWGGERLAAAACILLFIGACGKSAQIPLYVWLPDAMAGPTPVSALIHAATMVTAGVYMVARLSFVFVHSTTAMMVVATIGMLTAIVAAFYAFAQTDLKKVLAYSTVSQLGFMFVGVGTGNWVPAIFHLGTHAFFKAGLFLGAGSVMHAMSGSGDIMKMGGLRKKLPITHATFLIFCLAIAGIPPLAGFFSKDEILAGAYASLHEGWPTWYRYVLWAGLSVAALGTAIYMWRLYFLVFAGDKTRCDAETEAHIHESPWEMTVPLVLLALLTIVAGVIGLPHLWHPHGWQQIFHGLGLWLDASVADVTSGSLSSGRVVLLMGIATAMGALGIFIAWRLYGKGPSERVARFTATGYGKDLYEASANKLWVDEIYDRAFVRPFRWLARALFELVDKFVIDTVLVNGSALAVSLFGRVMRWIQNGQVQRYMVGIILGAALVFWWTGRSTSQEITWRRLADGRVEVVAYPGSGLAGSSAKLRWDLAGDGAWDYTPEVEQTLRGNPRYIEEMDAELADLQDQLAVEQSATGQVRIAEQIRQIEARRDAIWLSDRVIVRSPGEVGPRIRLEVHDNVSGATRVVETRIELPPAAPAGKELK